MFIYNTFSDFKEYYCVPFYEGDYSEYLNRILQAEDSLPTDEYENNLFELLMDESRAYTRTNDISSCLKLIERAHDKGFIFPLQWKNFALLRSHPQFSSIKLRNDALKKANTPSKIKYEVHIPKSYDKHHKHPLFK